AVASAGVTVASVARTDQASVAADWFARRPNQIPIGRFAVSAPDLAAIVVAALTTAPADLRAELAERKAELAGSGAAMAAKSDQWRMPGTGSTRTMRVQIFAWGHLSLGAATWDFSNLCRVVLSIESPSLVFAKLPEYGRTAGETTKDTKEHEGTPILATKL